MKRLPGIVFSAVLLILGSLFQLLMAAVMAFAASVSNSQAHSGAGLAATTPVPPPALLHTLLYAMCALFVLLAAWGIWTAVGLIRVRRWARYSVLVIGGCLAVIGLPSMLMMLVLTAVPMPLPAGIDPSQAHTVQAMTKVGFGVVGAMYALVGAVGISWLVYFNLKRVRESFAGTPDQTLESRRPFLISAVAVLVFIGAASCVLMAFLPLPGAIFGWILHGWAKAAVMLVYGALLAATGIGLWQLQEWGRRLAIAMQAFGLAQYAVYLLRPSLMTRMIDEISRSWKLPQTQPPIQFQTMLYVPMFGIGILFLIAVVWVLVRYRAAFAPPSEPQPAQLPANL